MMETFVYQTNIRTEAALSKVAPYLNKAVGTKNWQLDLSSSDRRLTIFIPGSINEIQVMDAVHQAGFWAVNLEDYYAIY